MLCTLNCISFIMSGNKMLKQMTFILNLFQDYVRFGQTIFFNELDRKTDRQTER